MRKTAILIMIFICGVAAAMQMPLSAAVFSFTPYPIPCTDDYYPVAADLRTDTYNVYDDAGNLLFVITPAVAPQMSTVGATWSVDDGDASPLEQCFCYEYDGRMRLRSKKAPDAAAVKYWYDTTGALVLTQDGSQRSRGVCSFALADSLGRAAVAGECKYSDALAAEVESRHVVVNRSTALGNLNGYMPNVTLSSADVFSSSYYDDYSHLSLSAFSGLLQKLGEHPALPQHKALPVGQPTGTWTKVLGAVSLLSGPVDNNDEKYRPIEDPFIPLLPSDSTTIANKGYLPNTTAVLYYDDRDRLIATATADHLGGLCLETSALNEAGMPLAKDFTRWPLSATEAVESHAYAYVYDNMARLSSLTLTRGDSVYTVQANGYDPIGQLAHTSYGNGCGLSFSYKPSGAMASISAANATGVNTFSQTLNYATGDTPSYSGNIGSIVWNGNDKVNRRYNFTYDGLGRLIAAAYSSPKAPLASFFPDAQPDYSTSYTYGLDSRPLTVRRKGVRVIHESGNMAIPGFGEIDNLTFTYAGSRLKKIYDAAEDVIYAGATDFNDGADADTEYTYDIDGRMISDANKGITSIKYNAIGLPAEVTFSDGSTITNRYGADGTLLQRVQEEPFQLIIPFATSSNKRRTQITVDDHIGPLKYNKDRWQLASAPKTLSRIDTPNGFISSGRMHYYIKDYQGNVRQVTDADGTVEQDNHYYPYGMLMGESSNILASARGYNGVSFNPYLYGSKEYLTTASANLLDFSARTYDPAAILFHTPDPLRDKFLSYNGYLYCLANPIGFTDFNGLAPEWWNNYSIETRFWGFVKAVGGILEATTGVVGGAASSWTGVGAVVGGAAAIHGSSLATAGIVQMFTGEETSSPISQAAQELGVPQQAADTADELVSIPLSFGASYVSNARTAANVITKSPVKNISNTSSTTTKAIGATGEYGEIRLAEEVGGVPHHGFKTDYGWRFVDRLVGNHAHEAKVGYTAYRKFIQQQVKKDAFLLQNNKIDKCTWHFYRSPQTGKIGLSKQLKKALEENNIEYIIHE